MATPVGAAEVGRTVLIVADASQVKRVSTDPAFQRLAPLIVPLMSGVLTSTFGYRCRSWAG